MVFGSTSVSVKERLGGDLRMTNTLDVGMRGRLRKQANAAPHPPLCEQSPAATADIIILIMVLSACGVLVTPYLKFICSEILPATFALIWEMVKRAPLAYGSGAVLILAAAIGAVEIYHCRSRRCHNPRCKGLKKPMEFDIQLKTEECLKSQDDEEQVPWKGGLQLRPQHKELENELRRLAPPNGKAILLFRASCGCPVAKLEAWGPKRSRRLKR